MSALEWSSSLLMALRLPPPMPRGAEKPGTMNASDPDRVDILVVEDEPEMVDAMIELFEQYGFTVAAAQNGQDALDWLESGGRPKMALVDLRMPVLDGWGFCERLAASSELKDLPVAIVSATSGERELPYRAHDAGHFKKPTNWTALIEVVKRYCGDRVA